jgi:hypothetical protein
MLRRRHLRWLAFCDRIELRTMAVTEFQHARVSLLSPDPTLGQDSELSHYNQGKCREPFHDSGSFAMKRHRYDRLHWIKRELSLTGDTT